MERRDFLVDISRLAAFCAVVPNVWRVTGRPRLVDDPFTLGVASGDPTPTGGVLWTRLAPRPHEPEGGMDGQRTAVTWELAADDSFRQILKQGRATAAPELGYSIHIDVDGLAADHWYFYRFSTGGATSAVGRFRTAPAVGATPPLNFAVASCQHYETGLFTAYDHMSREELDLVTHLGDYIYEYGAAPGRVRSHNGLEVRSLDDYRRRYALYKADVSLKAAHARCPWVVTWDDHEDEGASIESVDKALLDFGFPVGPITLFDEVGIDVGGKVGAVMSEAFGARMAPSESMRRVVESGRTGRKGRAGFYLYDKDGEKGAVDATVYALFPHGVARREVDSAEIQERCVLAMVNEAARCLDEGVLRSARDGDVGAVFGIGFPPFRGGPFRYVDSQGASAIVERLMALNGRFPGRFSPAEVLLDHARSQRRFYPAHGAPLG